MFQPGVSGNPSGRPKENSQVKELARAWTEQAIATLASIMTDSEAKGSERVSAATALLDRAYGKPAQAIVGDASFDRIMIEQIQRVIVDPRKETPVSLLPAPGPGQVAVAS